MAAFLAAVEGGAGHAEQCSEPLLRHPDHFSEGMKLAEIQPVAHPLHHVGGFGLAEYAVFLRILPQATKHGFRFLTHIHFVFHLNQIIPRYESFQVFFPKKASRSLGWLRGMFIGCSDSIAVVIRLERAFRCDADVVRLVFRENSEFRTDLGEVEPSDFLVEVLWKNGNLTRFVAIAVFPEVDLGERLVREAVRHHEGRVSGSAA